MSKSISFCTTCRNRLWQLQETLPRNLESISDAHEIVLVDFGSTDGLSDWIWNNYKNHIESKRLVFFEVKSEVHWNVARAKNLAHRLASGGYLFNLDADNFITQSDIEEIQKVAELGLHCWQFSQGNRGDGSFGRIGLPTELFRKIGGYDETFLPMGYQDIDILNRLVSLKHSRVQLSPPKITAVQNTVDQKISEAIDVDITPTDSDSAMSLMDQLNESLAKFKLQTEGPVRTGGGLSYIGLLNGQKISLNGFDGVTTETLPTVSQLSRPGKSFGASSESQKTISFCITSRNRLWQLEKTLSKNIVKIDDKHEIVLVDYGSTDGLNEWIRNNFKSYLENKRLVFFEVKNEVRWNVARAKNLAHRLASGKYLFNLDADNFVTTADTDEIQKAAVLDQPCWQWSGTWGDGSAGRIGAPRDLFMRVGGYDETLPPMGGQDIDLLNRMLALKCEVARIKGPQLTAVQN